MRSLKLKTVCVDAAGLPHVTLQHPAADLGVNSQNDHSMVITDEITGVPDDITDSAVVLAWRDTINLSWLGQEEKDSRHTFAFSEIGRGKIVR
jgi:hypothetical protein